MRIRILPAVLALTLVLCACSPAPAESTPTPTPAPSPTPSESLPAPTPGELTWTDQVFEKTWTTGDGVQLMTARYVLPAAEHPENDPAWAIITEYFKGQGEAYLEQAEDTAGFAEGDYDIAQASNYDFSPYAEEASYTVTYQNDSVVSFVRSYYSNFGAAYPTVLQLSEQFNRYDGARLHFSDFFSDPEEARARVLKAIHAVTDPLEGYRSADVDGLFHEDNFYLTDEGFVFYYQSEAIAPHAAGIPEFTIPYTDLSDLTVR